MVRICQYSDTHGKVGKNPRLLMNKVYERINCHWQEHRITVIRPTPNEYVIGLFVQEPSQKRQARNTRILTGVA